MGSLRTDRSGLTLLELAAALTLTTVLAALFCGLLIVQLGLARRVADRARTSDALRTTRFVLEGETRRMQSADVRAISADSLAARGFRGMAVPCSIPDSVRVVVRYRGDRLPEPRKDSLLIVTPEAERTAALLESAPAAPALCARLQGEVLLRLAADGLEGAALLLVFESGNYYLTSRALRYRIGAEGRQPITAEAFTHPGTRFTGASARGVGYRLHAAGGSMLEGVASFGGSAP